jgi:regulator of protease activity HflC (stomatin/prohibitin superfamily)
LFTASCVGTVKTGHVGVPVVFGDASNTTVGPGMHFPINPFCSLEEMSTRTENYWMSHVDHEGDKKGDDSVGVRSSNGLQMPVDLSVPYRLIPESAPWVLQNLGKEYITKILRPALSTAARRAAGHYTAEELYSTKRDEFAEKTRVLLEEELKKVLQDNYKGKNPPESVIVANQVLIGHIGIPDTVKNAIEAKLKADQEQQAMDFTIKRETKEAERKKVEAEGIRQFQEIVTKGIDEKLLRWKAIDATLKLAESNNTKVIIIGAGRDGLPVLLGSDGNPQIQVPNK